jgi:hypothetical protein
MGAHGYVMDTMYIHISSRSMDTHVYIMDATYTAATAAWINMDTSWILHTQQQKHVYTWTHPGYNIKSSMDTHVYIMDNTYTAATAA